MPAALDSATLPPDPSPDEIFSAFLEYLIATETELYEHQERAILEIFQDKNVILNTPTGSGKSLVALALQFKSLCQKKRSYYTVPIKALANEKFFSLCRVFGPENVGMLTGDATVNREAPVLCCTAEILANIALRDGQHAHVDYVIMDEFHYYSDSSRGSEWQIPLLILKNARFLLMSATLGEPQFFLEKLTNLTSKETILVQSEERPVPLEYSYSTTPLQEKIMELVEGECAPIYLIHFTQNSCADTAGNLLSLNFCSKEEKTKIARALDEADFRSPYGKEMAKVLRHGIGIHHAGLLPKYRLLVEKLTAQGLLKVVCGTDTLSVGINVPIRTVMFTSLCKYDGKQTKILAVRDFRQIAGRAGRRGFDTSGYVVVQAPEHVIENLKLEQKAAANPNKKKSVIKRKPPEKGFVHWDETTFEKLKIAPAEALVSSFRVQHSTLLNVLSREKEDGCAALRNLIRDSHETRAKQRAHRKHAFTLFRGLLGADILHVIPRNMRNGPQKIATNIQLAEDFSINHALSLYLLDALPKLNGQSGNYALDVISLIEGILENPDQVLRKQVDAAKSELMAKMKSEGVEYEERMERLEEVEWPKPGKDFIYQTFNEFKLRHPYLGDENVKPKSIAREMLENYQSFEDYVKVYKLERSEGLLLRHIGEVYKVLSQTIPASAKSEDLISAELFLEMIVRHTDSSLLEEWQKMNNTDAAGGKNVLPASAENVRIIPLSKDYPRLTGLVRNQIHTLISALARDRLEGFLALVEVEDSNGMKWSPQRVSVLLDGYYKDHAGIRLDPEARNKRHTTFPEDYRSVQHTLIDPDDLNDWSLRFSLQAEKTDATGLPVLVLEGINAISDFA